MIAFNTTVANSSFKVNTNSISGMVALLPLNFQFFFSSFKFYEQSCLFFVHLFLVKIGTSEPKSRLREISKEVAQRAGELRGLHLSRREPERSSPRRSESRHRGTDGHQQQKIQHKRRTFPFLELLYNVPFKRNLSDRGLRCDVSRLPSSLSHVQPASFLFLQL